MVDEEIRTKITMERQSTKCRQLARKDCSLTKVIEKAHALELSQRRVGDVESYQTKPKPAHICCQQTEKAVLLP